MSFTCATAPGVQFASREALREHYKSEHHRYNLRRKVAGLPMITKAQYDDVLARHEEAAVEKKNDHLKSKKKAAVPEARVEEDNHEGDPRMNVEEDEVVTAAACASDSLFDSRKFEDVPSALEYAGKAYGFFLPEVRYLADPEALLQYLSEKVKHHRLCLFCNRQFRSFHACQQHMVDKGHCKVAYDDDDALAELADFYDFSRDDDDDGEDSDEDQAEWSDRKARVTVLETGELLIRKGTREKIVGGRWLRRYYRQNFRLDDDRTSTLAVRGEQTQRRGDESAVVGRRDLHFFARGLALQVNKRALGGVVSRNHRAQVRHTQMNEGIQSGRSKFNKANISFVDKGR